MQRTLSTFVFSCTLVLLFVLWLSADLSEAKPGHAVIPYYKKRRQERKLKEREELLRICRNSRNLDPRCRKPYDKLIMTAASDHQRVDLALTMSVASTWMLWWCLS